MQVIDVRGTLVGTVKDVAIDIKGKELELIVTTRARTELEFPWSALQSIEDVVLLNREAQVPSSPAPMSGAPVTAAPVAGTTTCGSCGASIPAAAKFCPKCGSRLK